MSNQLPNDSALAPSEGHSAASVTQSEYRRANVERAVPTRESRRRSDMDEVLGLNRDSLQES